MPGRTCAGGQPTDSIRKSRCDPCRLKDRAAAERERYHAARERQADRDDYEAADVAEVVDYSNGGSSKPPAHDGVRRNSGAEDEPEAHRPNWMTERDQRRVAFPVWGAGTSVRTTTLGARFVTGLNVMSSSSLT